MQSPVEDYRAHAETHAQRSGSGIGAALTNSHFANGEHIWELVVTDAREWHYIRVLGTDIGPYPNLSPEDIEEAVAHFAESLPAQYRLRHLLNANPLHLGREGDVRD